MMNLPVIFNKILSGARRIGGTGLLAAKRHAPELMIGTGIVGFGATVFQTVRATNKTNDILEKKDVRVDRCNRNLTEDNRYTNTDYDNDIRAVNSQTKWALVKTWAPVATTGVASVILVLGGYRVLNGRYVATATAYKMLEAGYEKYRENVISEFGKDVDYRMRNSLKADELEAERKEREANAKLAEENKGKLLKKRPTTRYQYESASAVFDQYSEHWRGFWNARQVWEYLVHVQREMNDKLNIDGFVFLNDVLYRLGLPRTKEGQVLGWVRKNGPIDFGLDDIPEANVRDFLSETINENLWLRLHFNVHGVILNMIDRTPEILLSKE